MSSKAKAMPIATLLADPHNPREIDAASALGLGNSLERFGDLSRIVLNTRNGLLVAGHQRVAQLTAAGATEWTNDGPDSGFVLHPKTGERFSIRLVDWSDADHRVANLTANNPKIQGSYTDAAAEMLAALEDSVDYAALRLDALAEQLAAEDANTRNTDGEPGGGAIPDPPRVPISKAGDLWLLGDHRLLCGDARLTADVARLLGADKINVAVTSPPYASQRKYDDSSGFKPIRPDEYVEWFEAVQDGIARHLSPDGSFFLNIKEHCEDGQRVLYVKDLTLAHVRRWGWRLVDEFCWRNTGNGVPGGWNNRFKNAWEPIFHFSRQQAIKFRPESVLHASDAAFDYSPDHGTASSGSGLLSGSTVEERAGMARPSNVLELCSETSQADHSAPYPLGLPSFFIRAFSDSGDVVFDPFCGSGTTLMAAQALGRRCVATEISPAYCDVIVERWQNATGLKATRD